MVKCMQQDCEQSMEGGNANQASELGCRFMDPHGFCYINGQLQLWCAGEGKGNEWCNDGGEDWAPPPLGTAAIGHEKWVPKQNIHIYTSSASGVPVIDESKPAYNCACMKQCTCTYKKPRSRDGAIQTKCWCVQSQYDDPKFLGDDKEAQAYRDVIAAGKMLKSNSKKENCDCVCNGQMDT